MSEKQKESARRNAAIARAAKKTANMTPEERFWPKVNRKGDDECWPWMAAVRREDEGYGAFYFEGKNQPAQRFAWEFWNKARILPGYVACHSCDNPSCCNPAHIWIGTNLENDKDRVKKGRQCKGERQRLAKFTDRIVAAMRLMNRAGVINTLDVVKMYGVNYKTASQMLTGVNWKHVGIEHEKAIRDEAMRGWRTQA